MLWLMWLAGLVGGFGECPRDDCPRLTHCFWVHYTVSQHADFVGCMDGPLWAAPEECVCAFDLDFDLLIDLKQYAEFQNRLVD